MRRTSVAPPVLLLATALLLASTACDADQPGTTTTGPSRSLSTSATPSPTSASSPSESITPSAAPHGSPPFADVRLPADAPTTFDRPSHPSEIARADFVDLAPPGATVTSASVLEAPEDPIDQVAFAWRRGDDPFAPETGFAVWQRFTEAPPWRAVYAFTDAPSKGTLGISLQTGDLTGDGISDVLTFEMSGGSGACGTWRVIGSSPGSASELFRRSTCDAEMEIVAETLRLREAVFGPEDAHCCPGAYRVTIFEWDGRAFVATSTETTPA